MIQIILRKRKIKKISKKKKEKSEKPKRKFKNKIDQTRYESIQEDMKQDDKEINLFSKKVGSSSKKDNAKAVANIFGSHIGSILDFGGDYLLGELTDEEDLENETCALSHNASSGEESSDSEESEEDKPVDKQKKRKSVVNNESVDSHGE